MISVAQHSPEVSMAWQGKPKNATAPWWITPAACAALLGAFWVYVAGDLSELKKFMGESGQRLSTLEQKTKGIEELGPAIAKLDQHVNDLEKSFERAIWKPRAEAAGIKNPQIVSTSLDKNQTFKSSIPSTTGTYSLTYTILGYDPIKKTLSLLVNGRTPGALIKDSFILMHDVAPGVQYEVTSYSDPRMARIFIQILDLPAPNRAIFAIGQKTDAPGKPS